MLVLNGEGRVKRTTRIVSGETTTEDFEVDPGGTTVHGRILGDHIDLEHVSLELTVSSSEGDQLYRQGSADGTYQFDVAAGGMARLEAKAFDIGGQRLTEVVEFEIADNQPVVQDIEFGVGCTIGGVLDGVAMGRGGIVTALEGEIDLSGLATIEDIQAYMPQAENITRGRSDCDAVGLYEIRGLSPGAYTLVAVTYNPADEQDIAQWRWTYQYVALQEDGETLAMDFDFR